MKDALQEIATRLANSEYKNEEHIRLGVVLRLLEGLGWSIWNPKEVYAEFPAIPKEDATRVDVALFMPPQLIRPAVFIEVKAQGKLIGSLEMAERQLRDYNRNNQADISILTDGRHWRLYLSSAAGEFAHKCFDKFDLVEPDGALSDAELALDAFLSKAAVMSGSAVDDARRYLKRTDTERIMYDVLPLAQRDAEDDPAASLVACFLKRCNERGADCTQDQALAFLRSAKSKTSNALPAVTSNFEKMKLAGEIVRPASASEKTNARNTGELRLKNKRGADATGMHTVSGRFVVFSGSIAAASTPGFSGGYRNLRAQLEAERILEAVVHSDFSVFRLSRDYEFGSPSAAASVFCGRSANDGEWK